METTEMRIKPHKTKQVDISRSIIFLVLMVFSIINSAFAEVPGTPLAEVGKIRGIVQDSGDKISIPYATISLYKVSDSMLVTGTMSDSEGNFLIDKIDDGTYYIVIDFIGYSKKTVKDIKIEKGKKDIFLGSILLEKGLEAIAEIEITADKDAVSYKIDKKVINMSQKPEAAGGTVVDALQNTPSVQVDAEGNVSLRGSSNFTVLINGKPSPLSGSDALKQIPASSVETIEIITNPSAKYDPDGTAGIINIVMKKGYETGLNGIVNASVGTRWKNSADFNLNYRTDKANFFVSGNYANRIQKPTVDIFSESFYNDTLTTRIQSADRKHISSPYSVKTGIDLYLSETDMLTASGEYGYWGFGMDMDNLTIETTQPESSVFNLNTLTEMRLGGHYTNGTVAFDHDFAKVHDWVSSLTYSVWDGSDYTDVTESSQDNNLFERHRTTKKSDNYDLRFKSDYTKPLGEKSKLEAGYQYQIKDEDGGFKYLNFNTENENWIENTEFTNSMNFVRSIHSVYTTFGSEVVGFQYQAGLRAEYTDQNLSVLTTNENYGYKKFDLFPTLHITGQLPKEFQLQASYSRRINRPESWNLNPFPMYSDRYVRQGGNPALRPELTDSYELNAMKRLKTGFVSAEAYYRQTHDTQTQIMTLMPDGVIDIVGANIEDTYAYGVELSGNLRPVSWLNLFASANLYNYEISDANVTAGLDTKRFNSDFSLNATFSPTKTTRIQLTGFYNAPTLTTQGERGAMYGLNAGITQEFFKRKLSLTLNGQNVLNTMKYEFIDQTADLYTKFSFKMDYPNIMLTASYKINNYQKRQAPEGDQPAVGGGGMM